ncbi:hypothetical protein [Amycolatopsis sp. NPDC059657]|uniref:hypothetical protein n=1 Tax=Amycolatopsis sp. NPDC059657 TaxID=3346899 RepID=UPI00366DE962
MNDNGTSQYLAKAAELIAKAAAFNESNHGPRAKWPSFVTYQENALRCADAYTALAAIEHGQVPAGLVETILAALPISLTSDHTTPVCPC